MTTTTENIRTWATTNVGNASADAAITSADTQSPDTIDDNIRSIMASTRRESDDRGGAIVAGGTSTALTVTTASGIASAHIANGLRLCVRTASAATGAATIAVDGLSAVAIKKNDGTAIASGDWASGAILDLVYSATATAFIVANLPQATGTPAARASFAATKSSSQSIATSAATTVTWNTEAYDVGSYFTSNGWTPPAGTVAITATIQFAAVAAGSTTIAYLLKNGSIFHSIYSFEASPALVLWVQDQCSGSDVYTVQASSTDGNYTIDASIPATRFQGTMI